MRFDGRLDKWNDDRGFGFITPTRGGEPVFVHVSAFPRDGRRPRLGETLTFEVEPAGEGKKRAIKVERPGASPQGRPDAAADTPRKRRSRRAEIRRPFLGVAMVVILFALVAGVFYGKVTGRKKTGTVVEFDSPQSPATQQSPSAFRCDGRTYCSQMTSCEEAKYFLRNCPGTQMDGDHNGIPCEKQWCTGPFAR